MPGEDDPELTAWKETVRRELTALHDGAIVVGHSVGGTILIHTLADEPLPCALGGIVLIAPPFVGEGGWQIDDWQSSGALGEKLPRGVPIHLYHGLADSTVPPSHAELYARAIPQAHLCRLPDRDHQLNNDLREVAGVIKRLTPAV
jgi:pimeloyl-ACP methyl ester carboxylesterase